MAVNEFDTLKTLHHLWKSRKISSVKVKSLLKKEHDLELVSLTNEGIQAQSVDGRSKYSIK
jgi:hypoxanthine-guanine phosphoribosyltransferase